VFVFLSYAREDGELAERIRGTLVAAGFDCFLDTKSLPAGQEYNARIGQAIARADLFVFLLSTTALEPGSYTLTELAFAEKKWRNPAGYVLPVACAPLDLDLLPAYLRPINVLQPRGNIEAEILAWVEERAEYGGGGAGELTPLDRLTRWARQHQPPLYRQRRVVGRSLIAILFGVFAIGFGMDFGTFGGPLPLFTVVSMLLFGLFGAVLIVFGLVEFIRGRAGAEPIAAFVLDRTEDKHGEVTVHLLFVDDSRKAYSAVGPDATNAYPGEIGWAFVTGSLLLGFVRGAVESPVRSLQRV
jgi:hypothetical protein